MINENIELKGCWCVKMCRLMSVGGRQRMMGQDGYRGYRSGREVKGKIGKWQ